MKTHTMNIQSKFIPEIVKGEKQHEYRLNNQKNSEIIVGDEILLIADEDENYAIRVKVTDIEHYSSWKEALKNYWKADFINLYSSLEETVDVCSKFYPPEDVIKYGILAYCITPVK